MKLYEDGATNRLHRSKMRRGMRLGGLKMLTRAIAIVCSLSRTDVS